jgi:hypothetical protein
MVVDRPDTAPESLANIRFVLASALWAQGKDRARALELARAARGGYAAAPGWEAERAVVERWLAAREH